MIPIDYTVPAAYARRYDPQRYRLLVDEAVRLLSRRFTISFVAQGMIYLNVAGNKDGSSANLLPLLANTLDVIDEGELLDQVHRHVSTILYAASARETNTAKPYAQIKRKLAVRLYPPSAGLGSADLVTMAHLPGVLSLLMLDDEGAFASVAPANLSAWGVDAAEAFRTAIENASRHRVEAKRLRPKTPSGEFTVYLITEENQASSYALGLPIHGNKYVGRYGALVSVPSRGMALVTPLGTNVPADICVAFAATTGGIIRAEYERHERPVSQGVFWLDPLGVFTEVKFTREDGRVWAQEPERLKAMRAS